MYDFLQLVRGSSSGEETSTACLGAEIENLDLEDESMRIDLSPVHRSDQLTFEDRLEFDESIQREIGWERDAPQTAELTGGWEQVNKAQNTGASSIASDSAWSSWGSGAVGKEGSFSKMVKEDSPTFGEWKSKEPQTSKQSGLSSTWGERVYFEVDSPETAELNSGWEQAKKPKNTGVSTIALDSGWSSWDSGAVGKQRSFSKTAKEDASSYNEGNSKEHQSWKLSQSSSAGEKGVDYERDLPLAAKTCGNWEQPTDKAENVGTSRLSSDSTWFSWGGGHVDMEASFSNRVQENIPKYGEWGGKDPQSIGKQPRSSSAWRKIDSQGDSTLAGESSGDWDQTLDKGQNVAAQTTASDSAWSSWRSGQLVKEDSFFIRLGNCSNHDEWGTEKPQDTAKQSASSSAWGKKFDFGTDSPLTTKSSGGWKQATDKAQNLASHTTASDSTWSSWGTGESGKEERSSESVRVDTPNYSEWGAKESGSPWNQSGCSSTWGKKVLPNEVLSKSPQHNISARATASKHWSKRDIDAVQGEDTVPKREEERYWKSIGEAVEFEIAGESKKSAGTHSWDNKRDAQSQWVSGKWLKGDANESSRGWGSPSNRERKHQRTRPAKAVDNFSTSGTFTLTKQRMDRFAVEEQDILSDVEQMMQNIRRIIHQTG